VNTNMHVTAAQASTMLAAVRFCLQGHYFDGQPDDSQARKALEGAETMLLAALARIRDTQDRQARARVRV